MKKRNWEITETNRNVPPWKTRRECARSNYKQRNAKNSYKSKMADASSDILFDSVRFVLSNWAVLQLAVEHGFGGKDTAEKAEWMLNVINQVLRENGQYSYFQASQSIISRVLCLSTALPVEPYFSIITIILDTIMIRVSVYTLLMIVMTVITFKLAFLSFYFTNTCMSIIQIKAL